MRCNNKYAEVTSGAVIVKRLFSMFCRSTSRWRSGSGQTRISGKRQWQASKAPIESRCISTTRVPTNGRHSSSALIGVLYPTKDGMPVGSAIPASWRVRVLIEREHCHCTLNITVSGSCGPPRKINCDRRTTAVDDEQLGRRLNRQGGKIDRPHRERARPPVHTTILAVCRPSASGKALRVQQAIAVAYLRFLPGTLYPLFECNIR